MRPNSESVTSPRELVPQKHGFKSWNLAEVTFAKRNLEGNVKPKAGMSISIGYFIREFHLTLTSSFIVPQATSKIISLLG